MKLDFMQLEFVDPTLREILKDIEVRWGEQTTTSQFRIDDPGVHGTLPLRGWDLRSRKHAKAAMLCQWVNEHWLYDPKRPHLVVAIPHGEGSNFHIHLQTHPNTEAV